MALFDVEKIY